MSAKKPPSPKKLEANRRNSKHSTGPNTVPGKRRSSLNAVFLALYAKCPLLLDESKEDRDYLAELIRSNLRPTSPRQELCVWRIVDRVWIMLRVDRMVTAQINHEMRLAAMDRKFPIQEAAYVVGSRPVRKDSEVDELIAKCGGELIPTKEDGETALRRILAGNTELFYKVQKISLNNEAALLALLAEFDRLQKEEAHLLEQDDESGEVNYVEDSVDDTDDRRERPGPMARQVPTAKLTDPEGEATKSGKGDPRPSRRRTPIASPAAPTSDRNSRLRAQQASNSEAADGPSSTQPRDESARTQASSPKAPNDIELREWDGKSVS